MNYESREKGENERTNHCSSLAHEAEEAEELSSPRLWNKICEQTPGLCPSRALDESNHGA